MVNQVGVNPLKDNNKLKDFYSDYMTKYYKLNQDNDVIKILNDFNHSTKRLIF